MQRPNHTDCSELEKESLCDLDPLDALQAINGVTNPQTAFSRLSAWSLSFERGSFEGRGRSMTGQVAPTVEGRAQEVRRILDVDWGALKEKHLPYVTASLATHKPYGPLRMFVAAVQLCASEAYSELEPIIRNAISAEQAAMLTQHGHLTAAS